MKPGNALDRNSVLRDRKWIQLILLLAAGLRILGIWHSYPFSYYGDEVHFVERALSFGSLDLNPHWFHKPAFYMYVLFFEYGAYFVIGKIAGLWQSIADFGVAYMTRPGVFYLIGRSTTAAFGLGTIWMVYKLAREHFKRETGLVAALLLSLSFGHVAAGQHVKADVPTTFLTLVSMYFLLNFISRGQVRRLLLASVFAGVGAATKYYSLVMLGPIWVCIAVVAVAGAESWKGKASAILTRIAGATAVFWVAYFVGSPYSFLDPLGRTWTFSWARSISRSFSTMGELGTAEGSRSAATWTSEILGDPLNYVQTLLSVQGMGPVCGALGLVGIVLLLIRIDKKVLVFLSFPLAFTLGSLYLHTGLEVRHQLPLYPFLALAGGVLVVSVTKRAPRPLVFVVLALVLIQPLYSIVERGLTISKTDTRNLAKAWIEENIPPGTRLLMDEEGPVLATSPERLREELVKAAQASETGQFTAHYDRYVEYRLLAAEQVITYDIFEIRWPWWRRSLEEGGAQYLTTDRDRDFGNPLKPVGVNPYQFYAAHGFEFAVVQSERYERWFAQDSSLGERYPGFAEFYRDLFERGRLVKEFDPRDGNRPGPIVKVFALQ